MLDYFLGVHTEFFARGRETLSLAMEIFFSTCICNKDRSILHTTVEPIASYLVIIIIDTETHDSVIFDNSDVAMVKLFHTS